MKLVKETMVLQLKSKTNKNASPVVISGLTRNLKGATLHNYFKQLWSVAIFYYSICHSKF